MDWLFLIASIISVVVGLGLVKVAYTLLITKNYSVPALSDVEEPKKPLIAKFRGWESLALGVWFISITAIINFLHLPGKTWQIGIAGGVCITLAAEGAIRRRLSEKTLFTPPQWWIIIILAIVLPLLFAALMHDTSAFLVFSVLGGFVAALIVIRQNRNES